MAAFKRQAITRDEGRYRPVALGDLADETIDIFCWCNRCGHNATVAVERLVKQLGPGFAVPEVGAKMRCTGCGSKDVATRPAWPSLGQVAYHTE